MSASQNTPTYIILALYLLAMIIVTIIANRQNARATTESKSNMVKTHFLASKSFGVVVLLLTTFASVFSGYTVVGVPNEAGFNGFTAIRWIGGTGFVSVGFLIIFPRLRRISMVKEYTSPGVVMEIVLVALVFSDQNPFIAANPAFEKLDASWSALCGVGLNLVVCCIAHCVFGADHDDSTEDAADEDPLSIRRIREIMKGIDEPMTKYYGVSVILMAIVLLITAFHWMGEIDPALVEIYGSEGVKQLLFNGYVQNVIGGLPDWAFATMIWYGIATLIGIFAAYLWNTDAVHEGSICVADRSGAELQPTTSCVDDENALIAYSDGGKIQAITAITTVEA
eukprot:431331_1